MSKPARYREPIQPRANALETSRGGARRNRKTRRRARTSRPPHLLLRPQIEEAERRRMSHSRWWGSLNCGCKPQNGPKNETRLFCPAGADHVHPGWVHAPRPSSSPRICDWC